MRRCQEAMQILTPNITYVMQILTPNTTQYISRYIKPGKIQTVAVFRFLNGLSRKDEFVQRIDCNGEYQASGDLHKSVWVENDNVKEP